MSRKLRILSVATLVLLAASYLQAQECECPAKSCAGNAACQTCQKLRTGDAPVRCQSDCQQCQTAKIACRQCPHCSTGLVSGETLPGEAANHVSSFQANLVANHMGLPGSTSFIDQQSEKLATERDQLAERLAGYLASGPHDAGHIRTVLEMALDSTADQAHRSAMMYRQETPSNPPPLPPARLKTATTRPAPLAAASIPFRGETSPGLQRLRKEQAAMRDVVQRLQQDLQKVALDVSQMHAESRANMWRPANTPAPQPRQNSWQRSSGIQWQSQTSPAPRTAKLTPAGHPASNLAAPRRLPTSRAEPAPLAENRYQSVEQLLSRIQMLESQLRQRQVPVERSGVRQTALETQAWAEPNRLQPRAPAASPLTPVNMARFQPLSAASQPQGSVVVTYYVGDMMAPPFASATLQLMQFIKSRVDPESWQTVGKIEITEPSISLLICQTPENQEKIARLMTQIRSGALSYQRNESR